MAVQSARERAVATAGTTADASSGGASSQASSQASARAPSMPQKRASLAHQLIDHSLLEHVRSSGSLSPHTPDPTAISPFQKSRTRQNSRVSGNL
mmetsp:Transcript_41703/g.83666  ORF Transcript_41703/g.83666 Transcript_41703/m.83666 type:complete len:95 (-) Transcript_41703:33-317(-)